MKAMHAAFLLGWLLHTSIASAANHLVTAQSNNQFSPAALTIAVGDTVTFVNGGGVHNVVSDPGSVTTFRCANGCDGAGGNGNPSGAAWSATVTFATAGSIGYFCQLHGAAGGSGMAGSITVVGEPPFSLSADDQYLWLVPPASNAQQQGFLRLINQTGSAAEISVFGLDAAGERSSGTIELTLAANEARQFNSQDLELGNTGKGLTGSLGDGSGNWTVVVASDSEIEALTYIRTPDGFLTSMHERVVGDGVDWFVPMFNPAENPNQVSRLRVTNSTTSTVDVVIDGVDDNGAAGAGSVSFSLAALASIELSSVDLESGNPGIGLTGALGNGAGKWRLQLSSTGRVTVQSLLFDPAGYLTNLSTLPDQSELSGGERVLWLVPAASNEEQQGFVRVSNRSDQAGSFRVFGIDDAGNRSIGTITFELPAQASKQFNSQDLELGNASKGLVGSLGDGNGDWRVLIESDIDYRLMAYIRTPDGFLTAMHDTLVGDGLSITVPMFNPAENPNQVSELRLINRSEATATISISGRDDPGQAGPGGTATLTLAAGAAVALSSTDIEQGNAGKGLSGGIGDGSGKWLLTLTATVPIKAMSLLRDPRGYLTNLSNIAKGGSGDLDP